MASPPFFSTKLKPQALRFHLWLSQGSQRWGLRSHIRESGRENSQSWISSETWLKLRLGLKCHHRTLQPNQQCLVLLSWVLRKENSLKFPCGKAGPGPRDAGASQECFWSLFAALRLCLAQDPPQTLHGGGFCALFLPSPVPGAGTNNGSRKTSSMDLFPRSLLPRSSFHYEPKSVQYQAGQGVMIIYMAA